MDPLQSFEKRLLSGGLIDTSKIKTNRPAWLCAQRVPKLYRNLEAMVMTPISNDPAAGATASAVSPLNTALVYQLLLSSGLPQPVLAALWDQCSRTAPGVLLQHEFYQALALVAICQKGHPPNPALLLTLPEAPLPQLPLMGYIPPAPTLSPTTPPVHPSAIGTAMGLTPVPNSVSLPAENIQQAALVTQDNGFHNGLSVHTNPGGVPLPNTELPIASSQTIHHLGNACINDGLVQSTMTPLTQHGLMSSAFKEDVVDNHDDDDFADFQSAPVTKPMNGLSLPTSVGEHQVQQLLPESPLVENSQVLISTVTSAQSAVPPCGPSNSSDLFAFSNGRPDNSMCSVGSSSSESHKQTEKRTDEPFVPKAKHSSWRGPSLPTQRQGPSAIFPPVLPSLFDSVTVQMTEAVQPPTEPNPWLNYSLDQESTCDPAPHRTKITEHVHKKQSSGCYDKDSHDDSSRSSTSADLPDKSISIDDDFGDFADFQSAPSNELTKEKCETRTEVHESRATIEVPPSTSVQDRYSVFRALEPSVDHAESKDNDKEQCIQEDKKMNNFVHTPTVEVPSNDQAKDKVDILALMKLPSMPEINIEDDLAILDSLTISNTSENKASSALEELQDIDLGFTNTKETSILMPPTDSSPVAVSPAKSAASIESVGESRGSERRLSLFSNRANYSECASLSSFELGPNSESNGSSPTKGSILSLELNSPKRSPPDEEADDTLEWSVDQGSVQMADTIVDVDQTSKSPEEFCWAQPPVFPPPDPTTDFNKPPSTIQDLSDLCPYSLPNTKVQESGKRLTKGQVADSWARILGKVAAVLETGTHILGSDRHVVAEVLSTAKGQGYISSLLEVYNVSQQIKKAAQLFSIEGLAEPFDQVESSWRRQLEDITVRLGLSVICLDHIRSPMKTAETCAVCLLPLSLRPRILFGDNAYHATCANFWANVLAEGLPCLKLEP